MENLRLFIAVDFPAEITGAIDSLVHRLKGAGADIKWVEKENLHLTLKFLGDTPPGLLTGIKKALETVARHGQSFEIILKNLGAFPNFREPRVFWLGIREGGDRLSSLVREIDRALASLGIPEETRDFRPHLTLGRVRSATGLSLLKDLAYQAKNFGPLGPVRVTSFKLIKSQLTREGPVYTVLAEFPWNVNILNQS